MLKVIEPRHGKAIGVMPAVCQIAADTEEDITGMGEIIIDCGQRFRPLPGSIAYKAGFGVCYHLSPSSVWIKVAGNSSGGASGDAYTEDDALVMLAEMAIVTPVTDADGIILTDENGDIFII